MPDEFEPCPDEMCMGVIGPDGVCTQCGTHRDEAASAAPDEDAPDDGSDDEAREEHDEADDEVDPDEAIDDDLDDREPCPDGACIGIIGPDGRCTECGERAVSARGGPMRQRPTGDDREPCLDGACIGVIGPDGRCTECGGGPGAGVGDPDDAEDVDDWSGGGGFDPDDRVPCPDGACIGIIGSNGRCTECGRRPS